MVETFSGLSLDPPIGSGDEVGGRGGGGVGADPGIALLADPQPAGESQWPGARGTLGSGIRRA